MKTKLISILAALALSVGLHASCLPDAPQNVAAGVPAGIGVTVLRVVVGWSDSRTERSYVVQRSDWNGVAFGPWQTLAQLPRNSTTFTDYAPLWATPMLYRIVSVNGCGESASAAVQFTLQ